VPQIEGGEVVAGCVGDESGVAEAFDGVEQDMVAAVFRTIFAQPDAATVAATWDEVRDQVGGRFPKNRHAHGRGRGGRVGVHRVPPTALGQDLEHG
jgi:hypothetical protein